MSRYRPAAGTEAEFEPRSRHRVLRNLLGITSKSAMDEAEALALERVQSRYFLEEIVTKETRFTADLVKRMHRDWLVPTSIS